MGKITIKTRRATKPHTYARPSWVSKGLVEEEELYSDCLKVVDPKSQYILMRTFGKNQKGRTVGGLTKTLKLTQPTITHHLNTLRSFDVVTFEDKGRERIYRLNRDAHCFEDCKIPF